VRAARWCHCQLGVHGLALRLRPGDHGGQGAAARGGRRRGGRRRRQRGGSCADGAPGRPWHGRREQSAAAAAREDKDSTTNAKGGGGKAGTASELRPSSTARAALSRFAEGDAGRGPVAADGDYVTPGRQRSAQTLAVLGPAP
jgi:hypothetical protein